MKTGLPQLRRQAIGRYLAVSGAGNLIWEIGHLPLYTLWTKGSASEQTFAVAHCTAGDVLIATIALLIGLSIARAKWPQDQQSRARVAAITILVGTSYTVFSEWLNVNVREAWEYSHSMPRLPWLGTGLSPLLQWVIIPVMALRLASGAWPWSDWLSKRGARRDA